MTATADDRDGDQPADHQPPPPVADGVAEGDEAPGRGGRVPGAREADEDGLGVTVT